MAVVVRTTCNCPLWTHYYWCGVILALFTLIQIFELHDKHYLESCWKEEEVLHVS